MQSKRQGGLEGWRSNQHISEAKLLSERPRSFFIIIIIIKNKERAYIRGGPSSKARQAISAPLKLPSSEATPNVEVYLNLKSEDK
jgi:hypothetical protein